MNKDLKTWHFGINNDNLVELVLLGKKTATSSIYNESNKVTEGEESILIFDNEKEACVTKIKKVIITEFKNITEELSNLEGEGNYETWRKNHIDYFSSVDENFNEDTLIQFEIFEIVENLVEKRLNLAREIINNNKDIFNTNSSVSEINVGFNNSLFNVDNKYVIKICSDDKLFDVEVNYYKANESNTNIPKLYKADSTKKIIPYSYEILEKIKGQSVYYHWYKMNEQEREEFIQKLMYIIRNMHSRNYDKIDWVNYIKEIVINNFNKSKDMFNEEEQNIILESLKFYEKILSENSFSLIHNDLHFDNIFIDEDKNIKIIDFNDSMVAPFDYDLRIFYMCTYEPWKWANTEMDPYQKKEDYKNIFEYVKKYYPKLNNLKYLEERMLIYAIVKDIKHLPKYREISAKDKIVNNSKKILFATEKW